MVPQWPHAALTSGVTLPPLYLEVLYGVTRSPDCATTSKNVPLLRRNSVHHLVFLSHFTAWFHPVRSLQTEFWSNMRRVVFVSCKPAVPPGNSDRLGWPFWLDVSALTLPYRSPLRVYPAVSSPIG